MATKRPVKKTAKEPKAKPAENVKTPLKGAERSGKPAVKVKAVKVKAPEKESSISNFFSMDNARKLAEKGRRLLDKAKKMSFSAKPAMRKRTA